MRVHSGKLKSHIASDSLFLLPTLSYKHSDIILTLHVTEIEIVHYAPYFSILDTCCVLSRVYYLSAYFCTKPWPNGIRDERSEWQEGHEIQRAWAKERGKKQWEKEGEGEKKREKLEEKTTELKRQKIELSLLLHPPVSTNTHNPYLNISFGGCLYKIFAYAWLAFGMSPCIIRYDMVNVCVHSVLCSQMNLPTPF